jgi:hypothetical protein
MVSALGCIVSSLDVLGTPVQHRCARGCVESEKALVGGAERPRDGVVPESPVATTLLGRWSLFEVQERTRDFSDSRAPLADGSLTGRKIP